MIVTPKYCLVRIFQIAPEKGHYYLLYLERTILRNLEK